MSNASLYETLDVILDYDDGAVVYLNGREVLRVNLPGGMIEYATEAPSAIEDSTAIVRLDAAGKLQDGTNVVAVEVHQQSEHSSDLHFDLELVGNWGDGATPTLETWIEAGATWKYLDNGTNPGTAWTGTGFNDSAWTSGAAVLGYGDGHEATTVSYGSDPNNKHITTYFRKSFNITDPSAYTSFEVSLEYDDGAVVYLNGVELFRANMPTGTITYTTLAPTGIEDTSTTQTFPASGRLQAGTNVLAVEVHQYSGNSSDLHFELALRGTRAASQTPTEVVRKYYYADGQRVALREGGTLYYFLADHLGSATVTTSSTGTKVAELRYKPWGESRASGYADGDTPTDYRFTGQREEAAVGLYFYQARWYDAQLGRFLQADTIVPEVGSSLAWDRYAYTNNNPVRYIDPSGHRFIQDGPTNDKYRPSIAKKYVPSPVSTQTNSNTNYENPWKDPEYSNWRLLRDGSACTACHITHDDPWDDGRIPDNSQLDLALVKYYRSLDPTAEFVHKAGLATILNMVSLSPIDELTMVKNSQQVTGQFPLNSDQEYLYRPNPEGFASYDPKTGDVVFRVDLVGRADNNIPTPHTHYPQYHVKPSTGQVFFSDWSAPVPYAPDLNPVLSPFVNGLWIFFTGGW